MSYIITALVAAIVGYMISSLFSDRKVDIAQTLANEAKSELTVMQRALDRYSESMPRKIEAARKEGYESGLKRVRFTNELVPVFVVYPAIAQGFAIGHDPKGTEYFKGAPLWATEDIETVKRRASDNLIEVHQAHRVDECTFVLAKDIPVLEDYQ